MTFEGVEKRLEMIFSKESCLRETIKTEDWGTIFAKVQCEIEDQMSSDLVDSYPLSASSLFVFDDRLILKTCGEMREFEAIEGILGYTKKDPTKVKYTRGSYFWPEKQPQEYQRIDLETMSLARALGFENLFTKEFGNEKKTFKI